MDAVFLTRTDNHQLFDMTTRAIESLRTASAALDLKVFVVESSQSAQSNGFTYENCEILTPFEPFSYNRFMSIGVEHGESEYVLMCNNDIIFDPDSVENLLACMVDNGISSASPYEPNWHQRYYGSSPPLGAIYGYEVENHVCGWCICATRRLIQNAKPLDERFEFWFQDNNYSMCLKSQGVPHALVTNSLVYHRFASSHGLLGENKEKMTHGQADLFKSIWGGQADLTHGQKSVVDAEWGSA